jgi:hypothetical protein
LKCILIVACLVGTIRPWGHPSVSGHGLRESVAPPVSIVTARIENPVLFIELCPRALGMQLACARLIFHFRMSALATMQRHSDSQLIFQKVKVALILRFLALSPAGGWCGENRRSE